jgi:ribosomal protein L34
LPSLASEPSQDSAKRAKNPIPPQAVEKIYANRPNFSHRKGRKGFSQRKDAKGGKAVLSRHIFVRLP